MLVTMRFMQRTFWVQHQPRVQSKSTVSTAAYSFLYCFHWSFSIVIPEVSLPHLFTYLLYCSSLSSVILIIPHLSHDKTTTSLGPNMYRTILMSCVLCIVQKLVYVTNVTCSKIYTSDISKSPTCLGMSVGAIIMNLLSD